jgi:hypothetical protein
MGCSGLPVERGVVGLHAVELHAVEILSVELDAVDPLCCQTRETQRTVIF